MALDSEFKHDSGNAFGGTWPNHFAAETLPSQADEGGSWPNRWKDNSSASLIWYDRTENIWVPLAVLHSGSISDTVKFGDTVAHRTDFRGAAVTDGVKFSDVASPVGYIMQALIDGVKFGDSVDPTTTFTGGTVITDTVKFGDTLDFITTFVGGTVITDTVKFGDTTGPFAMAIKAVTDGVKFGDAITPIGLRTAILDGCKFGDTVDPTVTFRGDVLSDGVKFGDVITPVDISTIVTDGVKFGDTTGPIDISTLLLDGVKFSDAPDPLLVYRVELTDGAKFGDTAGPVDIWTAVLDGVIFSDTNDPGLIYTIEVSDGVVFGDTPGPIDIKTNVTDGVKFGESALNVGIGTALSDGALFGILKGIPVRNWSASASDGVVFDERTWYHRLTSEHDIFVKALLTAFDFDALRKDFSAANINVLPLIFNNPVLPVIYSFSVKKKTYNTEAE